MNAHGLAYRPHDLLWLTDADALTFDKPRPGWATPAWLAVAPVVVRRATPADVHDLPVGLRGATRSDRCAANVRDYHVLRACTPETVAGRATTSLIVRNSTFACLRTLARLAPALDAAGLAWGVTGSVGFTLASGAHVLRPDSDLDLLVRAPVPAHRAVLRVIAALVSAQTARVDIQVETQMGAFALQEWMRTGGPVLLKTNCGAVLSEDAWAPLDTACTEGLNRAHVA